MSDDQVLNEATKQRIELWRTATPGIRALFDEEPVSNDEVVVLIDVLDDVGWRVATAIAAHDETGESLEALIRCRTIGTIGREVSDDVLSMMLVMTIDDAIDVISTSREQFDATMRVIRSKTTTDMLNGVIVAFGGITAIVVPRAQYTNKTQGPFTIAPFVGIS